MSNFDDFADTFISYVSSNPDFNLQLKNIRKYLPHLDIKELLSFLSVARQLPYSGFNYIRKLPADFEVHLSSVNPNFSLKAENFEQLLLSRNFVKESFLKELGEHISLIGDKRQIEINELLTETKSCQIIEDGKLKEVLVKSGASHFGSFVDQLTFTFNYQSLNACFCHNLAKEAFEACFPNSDICFDYQRPLDQESLQFGDLSLYYEFYISGFARILNEIFGFTISKHYYRGLYNYERCYFLGTSDSLYGRVMIGGNGGTICVQLTSTGLLVAKSGWQQRLYNFSNNPKIFGFKYTRVDVAKDFFNGEYTPELCLIDYENGLFAPTNGGRYPKIEKVGKDWFNEDDESGKTLYIGGRTAPFYFRCYEKGKQLGDKSSKWTRIELEIKDSGCVIPLDIVLFPDQYITRSTAVQNLYKQSVKNAHYVKLDKSSHLI